MLAESILDTGNELARRVEQLENEDQRYYEFAGSKQRDMDKKLKTLWDERMDIVEDAYNEAKHELHLIGREGREPRTVVKESMRMIHHLERELEVQKFKLAFVLKEIENECS